MRLAEFLNPGIVFCFLFSSVSTSEARLSGSSDHESANEETARASVQRASQHQHLGDGSATLGFLLFTNEPLRWQIDIATHVGKETLIDHFD